MEAGIFQGGQYIRRAGIKDSPTLACETEHFIPDQISCLFFVFIRQIRKKAVPHFFCAAAKPAADLLIGIRSVRGETQPDKMFLGQPESRGIYAQTFMDSAVVVKKQGYVVSMPFHG